VLKKARLKLNSGKAIPADIRSAVYNSAARAGKKKEHALLLSKYMNTPQHEEQERIGRALAQFQEPKLLLHTLNFSLSEYVRFQDAPFMIAAVLQNPAGRDLAWKFITRHWPELVKRYGDGLGLLGRLIKAAGVYTSVAKAKEIEAFFKRHRVPGANRTVQQVLEKILSNADWLERDQEHLNRWLRNHYEK